MDRNIIEERKKEMEMYFNIVGSGFGEEIDERIKSNQAVNDYVFGIIDIETMAERLIEEAKNGI